MTIRLRNPFKLRNSEKIDSDASFLRIYSPNVLESLVEKDKQQSLWNDILFIRSSPGAGKTSLLRIFEPTTLVTLFNSKSQTALKELREFLKKLHVVDNDKINLLGVSLHCTRNYENLEDLAISDAQKKRLFFALINARVITATIRGIIQLKQSDFPSDLDKISISYTNEHNYFKNISFPCTGKELYIWAENIEKKVFDAMDSFLPIEQIQPEGHDELFAFYALNVTNITFSGNNICNRILFMFDDTHKLSATQRTLLLKFILEKRGNQSIWISERLEALSNEDSLGSFMDRDYNEINLEEIWQNKESKFRAIAQNIAERRANVSTEDVTSFEENLEVNINEVTFNQNFINGFEKSLKNLEYFSEYTSKFDDWILYLKSHDGTSFEKARIARSAEILANKNMNVGQLTMDVPMTVQQLDALITSEIQNATEYFLAIENKIPYYFSFERLVKISSSNIDQFLQFSGDLFESMLSNKIASKNIILPTEVQEKILRRSVENRWDELPRLIPHSKLVIKLLQKFQEYAFKETNRPTIPYAPGVTGFAIKAPNKMKLIEERYWLEEEVARPLVDVLATCISYNLLERRTISQGKKGSESTTVYYLNRWLCVKFNLPLGYGGWRSLKSDDLLKWLK
ncbi:hypothetical protein FYC62_02640 [Pedobacter aquae]|uniref:Uncharacterized protein n=1 Tax=Pedobacter aquae TaxID=2605747 RepID=A0A5C0VFN1_9SPHI|nr:hypothetical protein [Pedobacter aquae]QEK50683.1 hypothetical protein FYC62_02640 [Pedobacter aquae]